MAACFVAEVAPSSPTTKQDVSCRNGCGSSASVAPAEEAEVDAKGYQTQQGICEKQQEKQDARDGERHKGTCDTQQEQEKQKEQDEIRSSFVRCDRSLESIAAGVAALPEEVLRRLVTFCTL